MANPRPSYYDGRRRRRRYKGMEWPEKAACCTLCWCMALAVFSSVALIYLTSRFLFSKKIFIKFFMYVSIRSSD